MDRGAARATGGVNAGPPTLMAAWPFRRTSFGAAKDANESDALESDSAVAGEESDADDAFRFRTTKGALGRRGADDLRPMRSQDVCQYKKKGSDRPRGRGRTEGWKVGSPGRGSSVKIDPPSAGAGSAFATPGMDDRDDNQKIGEGYVSVLISEGGEGRNGQGREGGG